MKLTRKDLLFLHEIDCDSRTPLSKIGKTIKMSQQLTSYKMKSFMDNSIIEGFYPLIDYSKLGYLAFRVFFKINYIGDNKFAELIKHISEHPNVAEIIGCDGRYDLIVVFLFKNPSSFNKALRETISDNPRQLKNFSILTSVVNHLYPRAYFLEKKNAEDMIVGGDRGQTVMDNLNKKILFYISKDGRISTLNLASQAGVTPKTIISRLKWFRENGIIKGYKTLIDVQKLGFLVYKILFKYHNISVEKEEYLRSYCTADQNITEFIKLFGEWDLELTVETKTKEEFRKAYIVLREKFEDIIEDSDNFMVLKTYKRRFVPDEYFEGVE